MKQDTITVSFDAERLRAIKLYMNRKGILLESELAEQLKKLYERFVPVNVRDYIEEAEKSDSQSGLPQRETVSSDKKKG
ncbi:MAG: DUF6103 family protein [Bacteroidales bacterium]|nr:DUF6103 family protein [Bacteroidales bacterium]